MQVPAPFAYERATSVDHALELLERLGPEARLLAGGHSLLPMMKLRVAAPEHLIDLDPLAVQLGYIREQAGEVRIGAMTRHREILASDLLARRLTMFTDAERLIADPLVRNRGTIGGALCQADPAEDLSSVIAALQGRAVIRSRSGEREVAMREFHVGPYETVVGEAEMLIEVRVPLREGAGSAYEKVKRRAGDWAVAAVGAALWLSGGTIEGAGIGTTAVGGGVTSERAEAALVGERPAEEVFDRAAEIAAEDCDPVADQRGSVDYKRHLTAELTRRALRRAAARALGAEA
ncbi:MAG: xanthine dehydrogenase family protein subunit M [Solirubrobacterales bacterium]|nr:xanthine dehydrogenase family protein subunit M [Solirubrobacterales bacterium]MBV9714767.1 xanthine dehydrogenase family protein subunit M [Solirubrobacterales bacterium]